MRQLRRSTLYLTSWLYGYSEVVVIVMNPGVPAWFSWVKVKKIQITTCKTTLN